MREGRKSINGKFVVGGQVFAPEESINQSRPAASVISFVIGSIGGGGLILSTLHLSKGDIDTFYISATREAEPWVVFMAAISASIMAFGIFLMLAGTITHLVKNWGVVVSAGILFAASVFLNVLSYSNVDRTSQDFDGWLQMRHNATAEVEVFEKVIDGKASTFEAKDSFTGQPVEFKVNWNSKRTGFTVEQE